MNKHIDTSPKHNKVIVIYSRYFLEQILKQMYENKVKSLLDASGTYWDMISVKAILAHKHSLRKGK